MNSEEAAQVSALESLIVHQQGDHARRALAKRKERVWFRWTMVFILLTVLAMGASLVWQASWLTSVWLILLCAAAVTSLLLAFWAVTSETA